MTNAETQTKVCTGCGETKPATVEFFKKQKGGLFGLASICRGCLRAREDGVFIAASDEDRTAWRAANVEKRKAANREKAGGDTKVCSDCGERLPATTEYFSPSKKGLHGLRSNCKACNCARTKAVYSSDPEAGRARAQNYRDKDRGALREKERAAKKAWAEANRNKIVSIAETIRKCPGCGVAKPLSDKFFHVNRMRKNGFESRCKECNVSRLQAKREANRDLYRAYNRKSNKKRYADPKERLNWCVGNLIRASLPKGAKKRVHWPDILGFSLDELRTHLERQFLKGMTWENYGKWHVDHRLPVASFAFASPDDSDFKACWSLTNLQPLWAKDNLSKNNKRIYLL